ncbi:MAG: Uma2 family endonuclease [Nitrospirae bacterium]|nr:Uma2 family endonuclease [Nitrospirota bacterium]
METQISDKDFDLTEIINGVEVMGPSPFGKHQAISMRIVDIILYHLRENRTGNLYFSPLDVILKAGVQELQPDIIFIRKENMGIFQDYIRGVPDMVCEIVSKGSVTKDTVTKKKIYEKFRVTEYWIVIPELETIEIFTIEGDAYEVFSIAEGEGVVKSRVIEGLEINVKDVFGDFSF